MVNPFIGTGGHGHTFPGAVWPFGMVQLSPDTRVDGSWDGCSGYHFSDKKIYGFSHTHLSGTGCSDWGDILVLPCRGDVSVANNVYASEFDHKTERASAGYYKVFLQKYAVEVELTVTPRVGIHRYTFSEKSEQKVLIDLLHRDKTLESGFTWRDSVTLTGFRISQAWAKRQVLFFAIKFSKPIKQTWLSKNGNWHKFTDNTVLPEEQALLEFDGSNKLMIKVALSPVSEEGALKNMEAEASHWDFEKYKQEAEKAWEEQLSKIEVQTKDKNKKTIFYTALYHCCIHPSLSMDVDGKYRGRDEQIHKADGFTYYSVFSLWDTYRALHPLLNILEPEKSRDFIRTFLEQYRQVGRLPIWELSSNETDCMIGFHSVPVILDAYQKGLHDFDQKLALEAMVAASSSTNYGIPYFNTYGYLPVEIENESVSKSLEYAYDNWCIARFSERVNLPLQKEVYDWRAQAYRNLFDPGTGHMRPRKNGNWLSPFYPEEINNHFTEGNSWQYSFYVPHDIPGLISLHGGKKKFENKLDALFSASTKTRGREQADVTGLIGQYAHGNEPSHHMVFLYNYTGSPQKTSVYTQKIMKEFYKNDPNGLIGNEDCGQMSAWLVFSAMGFYPVCPGSNQYATSIPYFNSVRLNLPGKRSLNIVSKLSPSGSPIGYLVKDTVYALPFISHEMLMNAGEIEFLKTKKSKPDMDLSYTFSNGDYVPAPLIESPGRVFMDSVRVQLRSLNSDSVKLYYTTNGEPVEESSYLYNSSFVIKEQGQIRAKALSNKGKWSAESVCNLNKIKYQYKISIPTKVNSQYKADGPLTLFDGIYGDWNWRKGDWLGYQGQDVQIDVDFKEIRTIENLRINTMQDRPAWIFFPSQVEFYTSSDGINYIKIDAKDCDSSFVDKDVSAYKFESTSKSKSRYLRVILKNPGKLPSWHPGAGGESFIFIDELEIGSSGPATN